jgi:hypothetical protein
LKENLGGVDIYLKQSEFTFVDLHTPRFSADFNDDVKSNFKANYALDGLLTTYASFKNEAGNYFEADFT